MRQYCSERLARYEVPARVIAVDDLPRNATGKTLKTLKGELRRRLLTESADLEVFKM